MTWLTEVAVDAAERAEEIAVWSWLFDKLGFDPCHPALRAGGLWLGALRGCDLNGAAWQVTGLPSRFSKQVDRAVLTLPVLVDGTAIEVYALDPLEPTFCRHMTDLSPVMPLGYGGAYFPPASRFRLHGKLLDWLKGVALDLIAGRAVHPLDTDRVWIGDWHSLDALGTRTAIGQGKAEAVCDDDHHARAIRRLVRPPLPKTKIGVAVAEPAQVMA